MITADSQSLGRIVAIRARHEHESLRNVIDYAAVVKFGFGYSDGDPRCMDLRGRSRTPERIRTPPLGREPLRRF
jgi:hypothetical protein